MQSQLHQDTQLLQEQGGIIGRTKRVAADGQPPNAGVQVWLPARAFVRQAIEKRHEVDESGEIILLKTVCPWKEHLYELEQELQLPKPLKYCIYEASPDLHPQLHNKACEFLKSEQTTEFCACYSCKSSC